MLTGLTSDLAAARRSLLKNPTYTFFAVLCLALGIGATTAVFSVVDAFLLRPLPYHEPSQLTNIWMTVRGGAEQNRYFVDPKNFTELQQVVNGFEVAGLQQHDFNLSLEGEPRRVRGVYATANLFELLGVPMLLGRTFTLAEEESHTQVCLISEEFWNAELGRRADVTSQVMHINGVGYDVIGVVPAGRGYPDQVHIWIPVTREVREGRWGFTVLGRHPHRLSVAAVNEELARVSDYLREKDPLSNQLRGMAAAPLNESINPVELSGNLWSLLGVVGFLLAIACANVASLLLVRLQRQAPELAIQAALGATRRRLMRRVIAESLLLALAGGAFGLALAYVVTPALVALSPVELPRFREMGVDGRLLAFAALLVSGTLLVFSAIPAWRAAAGDPAGRLSQSGRGSLRALARFQRLLAVADVALALVLVAGAGLMINSFARLASTPIGIDVSRLHRVRMVAPPARAETHQGRVSFIRDVEEGLAATPGVASVGASHSFPVGGIQYWVAFMLLDRPEWTLDDAELAVFQLVTPGFFDVMGLEPLAGRLLNDRDRPGAARAIVVTDAFASHYWPDESALGKQLRMARSTSPDEWWTIVGVVRDMRDRGLAQAIGPSIYFPQRQLERRFTATMDLFVRGAGAGVSAATLARETIRRLEPGALVYDVAPMSEVLAETLQRERFTAVLTAILAGLALVLAGAGIYGVISYGVRQRRAEMGVRMAFGARGADLRRLVVAQSVNGVLIGLVLGNLAVLGLGRVVASQLHEVAAHDPTTLALASVLIFLTGLVAGYLPARRTSRIDPVEALREA